MSYAHDLSVRTFLNGKLVLKRGPDRLKELHVGKRVVLGRYKTATHFEYKVFGRTVLIHDYRARFCRQINNAVPDTYDDIYICRHNIGEAFVYLSHLTKWTQRYGSKRPALLVWRERDLPLYEMFVPENIDLVRLDLTQRDIGRFVGDVANVGSRRIISGSQDILASLVREFDRDPRANFYDYILDQLGVDRSATPHPPHPRESVERSVLNRMRNVDLRAVVLLVPEATSLQELPSAFWQRIVRGLERRGYTVMINGLKENLPPDAASVANLNVEELYCLAQKVRGIIGLASGLNVLLTAAGREMDVIHTRFRDGVCNSATSKQIYSLGSLPGVDSSRVREHDFAAFEEDVLIDRILSRYDAAPTD